jgi:Chalcone isomerase-like
MRVAPSIVLLLFLAAPVRAGELAGVRLPDEATVEGKTLALNGMGLREATMLKVDVYVAGLYLERKSSDADEIITSEQTKRIVMKFVRAVGRKDLVKAWTEGFEKNTGTEKDRGALKTRFDTLNTWMTDMTRDGVMSFTYFPGTGVIVEVQGQTKGTLPGADFARVLWSIWLGPNPPNPGLKEGLLGRGQGAAMNAIPPGAGRRGPGPLAKRTFSR